MKNSYFKNNTGIGVKALIINKNKMLVLNKRKDQLDLPGGRVENNESILEALIREIREETQLIVTIIKIVAQWSLDKDKFKIKGFTFLCNYVEGNVVISNEHTDFFWIDINKVNKLEFIPSYGMGQISMNKIADWQENVRFWSLPQIN